MYLVFAMIAGVIGDELSIGMGLQMQQPGMQISHDAHMLPTCSPPRTA